MEVYENAPLEQFAFSMCHYVFLKFGVIRDDSFEARGALFTEAIGKTVLYHRLLMKDCLSSFFTPNFNRIVADFVSIAYEFCSRIYHFSSGISFTRKFFQLSACVLELFMYCRESNIPDVHLCRAPRVWKTIFDLVLRKDFNPDDGWKQITTDANLFCEQLSPYFDPLIELINDPYDDIPDIVDLPGEFANTGRELAVALQKSYNESTLSFLSTVPPPILLRQEEEAEDDESEGSTSSPPAKRFKSVHKVFGY